MEYISHNAEKITALGDKLSQIQLGIQNNKYSKLEKIDEALKSFNLSLVDFNTSSIFSNFEYLSFCIPN